MAKGLSAIMKTAAAPYGDDLEREMEALVQERERNNRIPTAEVEFQQTRPPKLTEPLSDDAKQLISKAIVMAAEQLAKEAREAVDKYVEDAAALQQEVEQWAEALQRNAKQTASDIAERHAALLRSRPLFQRAMSGDGEQYTTLPNPLPPKSPQEPPQPEAEQAKQAERSIV